MEDTNSFSEAVTDAWEQFWNSVSEFLPEVLGAFLVVVAGALLAKLLEYIVERVLTALGLNKLRENRDVKKVLNKHELDFDYVRAISRTVFWVTILVSVMVAADVLQLDAASNTLNDLIAYVPNLLAAVIVLALSVAGARLARSFVRGALDRAGVDYASAVATASWWAVIIFGLLLTADQLGFDTTLLTANVTVLFVGAALTLALAFGLGGRSVAGNLIGSTLTRRVLKEGDKITVVGVTGTVKTVNESGVVISTSSGDHFVSHNEILGSNR